MQTPLFILLNLFTNATLVANAEATQNTYFACDVRISQMNEDSTQYLNRSLIVAGENSFRAGFFGDLLNEIHSGQPFVDQNITLSGSIFGPRTEDSNTTTGTASLVVARNTFTFTVSNETIELCKLELSTPGATTSCVIENKYKVEATCFNQLPNFDSFLTPYNRNQLINNGLNFSFTHLGGLNMPALQAAESDLKSKLTHDGFELVSGSLDRYADLAVSVRQYKKRVGLIRKKTYCDVTFNIFSPWNINKNGQHTFTANTCAQATSNAVQALRAE